MPGPTIGNTFLVSLSNLSNRSIDFIHRNQPRTLRPGLWDEQACFHLDNPLTKTTTDGCTRISFCSVHGNTKPSTFQLTFQPLRQDFDAPSLQRPNEAFPQLHERLAD
ncbi:hypothetical protein BV898_12837 [Hypsibius exemplaris]|uniref:Uncharacterized protein n=1 Tax=Hypsibius exemplaris TaxID=2072580 RepID=A0A1W0WCH7_HYPEX|nr:hypothetical protein BV898_12837 [Hypsibius exemplaris]